MEGMGSGGGFDRLHFLLERAFDGTDISLVFLKARLPRACCRAASCALCQPLGIHDLTTLADHRCQQPDSLRQACWRGSALKHQRSTSAALGAADLPRD